jgi:hypothetical protein
MTPILLCEYIVATALGLSAAVFVFACLSALIKFLFVARPTPEADGFIVGNGLVKDGKIRLEFSGNNLSLTKEEARVWIDNLEKLCARLGAN